MLEPTIKALMPDPSTLVDMDKAAARLADAVQKRERVAVFGDYDVDGACSSALMRRFLLAHGLDATHLHPRPHVRGLRPQHPPRSKSLVEKGAQLIVTVDCGTTSFEPLAPAQPARRRRRRRRPPSGRRAAARRRRRRQSEPAGRSLRPRPSLRRRRRLHAAGGDDARAAHARRTTATLPRRPTSSGCSISSRSRRCATWCRSRRSIAPMSRAASRSCASAATSACGR